MYDRNAAIERSRADARRLGAVSIVEVTPSRRDFGMYVATQKQSLALIARISDSTIPLPDLLANALALDDAEVAAIALSMGEGGLEPALVRELSQKVSAPLLRSDYIVAPNQLYFSRLQGFDAVLIPAQALSADEIRELAAVAASLHMSAVIEVENEAQVTSALRLPHVSVGIRVGSDDAALRLAKGTDPARVVIAFGHELTSATQASEIAGVFDAVVVSEVLARQLL